MRVVASRKKPVSLRGIGGPGTSMRPIRRLRLILGLFVKIITSRCGLRACTLHRPRPVRDFHADNVQRLMWRTAAVYCTAQQSSGAATSWGTYTNHSNLTMLTTLTLCRNNTYKINQPTSSDRLYNFVILLLPPRIILAMKMYRNLKPCTHISSSPFWPLTIAIIEWYFRNNVNHRLIILH